MIRQDLFSPNPSLIVFKTNTSVSLQSYVQMSVNPKWLIQPVTNSEVTFLEKRRQLLLMSQEFKNTVIKPPRIETSMALNFECAFFQRGV